MIKFTAKEKVGLRFTLWVFLMLSLLPIANHYDKKAVMERYQQQRTVAAIPGCILAKQIHIENGATTQPKDVLVCRNGPTGWVIQPFREVPVCKICHCGKTLCDRGCSEEQMCMMKCEKDCKRRKDVPSSSRRFKWFIVGFVFGVAH